MRNRKRKLKFKVYKNCLKGTQLENKIKNDSIKREHKELIKNNKLKLKAQHRFKSEMHNVSTEETNKILLS